jgi:hypothetical protein
VIICHGLPPLFVGLKAGRLEFFRKYFVWFGSSLNIARNISYMSIKKYLKRNSITHGNFVPPNVLGGRRPVNHSWKMRTVNAKMSFCVVTNTTIVIAQARWSLIIIDSTWKLVGCYDAGSSWSLIKNRSSVECIKGSQSFGRWRWRLQRLKPTLLI